MKTIGFIGVGELALYTISGVRRGGYKGRILLSPRNRENAEQLVRQQGCEMAASNQAVVDASDYVVISTRPAQCLDTLASLEFRAGQLLVSVVAGLPIEQLRAVLPETVEIVRAMPVSSAECGASATMIYPQQQWVAGFFDHCGETIASASEAAFDQGSVLACVYSWFFQLFDTLIEANQSAALPRDLAAQLVMGMASGAAKLALEQASRRPVEIAEHIASEGTYSKLGLDLLKQQRAFAPWKEASELLRRKLAEDKA